VRTIQVWTRSRTARTTAGARSCAA
jgi:hypothetical protein